MLVNLNEVLKDAKEKKYAVGLFNTTDTDLLEGVISAAEELSSPVIIGTAEVLLPYGELRLISPSTVMPRACASRTIAAVARRFSSTLPAEPSNIMLEYPRSIASRQRSTVKPWS